MLCVCVYVGGAGGGGSGDLVKGQTSLSTGVRVQLE